MAQSSAISDYPNTTLLDWKETPTAHIFTADLPGLAKEDVKLELIDHRVLQISGESKHDEEGESKDEVKWHCRERGSGKVLRRLRLPENSDVESVKAKMEDGVLTVTVAKREEGEGRKKEKVRRVEISGGDDKKKMKKNVKKGVFCCGLGV